MKHGSLPHSGGKSHQPSLPLGRLIWRLLDPSAPWLYRSCARGSNRSRSTAETTRRTP